MTNPSGIPVDINAITTAVQGAVQSALVSNPDFQAFMHKTVVQPVAEAARQALADAGIRPFDLRDSSVMREIQRATVWPVNAAIADAVGFETMAQGTHPEMLRVNHAMQAVNEAIETAVREPLEERLRTT